MSPAAEIHPATVALEPLHAPDGVQAWRTDRHPLIPGPWADEPDKVQWIDQASDLDCLAVRNGSGAWCGYVGLPPGHPWHGKDYHDEDVPVLDVHGGLTFSDACHEGGLICHVPLPGRPDDVWWFGFDCAHAGDLVPLHIMLMPSLGETYRTLDYVREQCAQLAAQLAAATQPASRG